MDQARFQHGIGRPRRCTGLSTIRRPHATGRAVRRYGGIDVLDVVEVEPPAPGRARSLVRVKAAGINPGEANIREGLLHDRWPATFPSGQGSDLAGVVEEVGRGVDGVAVGDEVIGFTHNRASQAELVVAEAAEPHAAPGRRAVGGRGLAVRRRHHRLGRRARRGARRRRRGRDLRRRRRRRARSPCSWRAGPARPSSAWPASDHHEWLRDHGVIPVDAMATASPSASAPRPAAGSTRSSTRSASGYVDLAIELGVAPERIDTIIDWDGRALGVEDRGQHGRRERRGAGRAGRPDRAGRARDPDRRASIR